MRVDVDNIYSANIPGLFAYTKHKRSWSGTIGGLIYAEMVEKYLYPLEDNHSHLYNPDTGQITSADVNVADSIVRGEMMKSKYNVTHPNVLHNGITGPIPRRRTSKEAG